MPFLIQVLPIVLIKFPDAHCTQRDHIWRAFYWRCPTNDNRTRTTLLHFLWHSSSSLSSSTLFTIISSLLIYILTGMWKLKEGLRHNESKIRKLCSVPGTIRDRHVNSNLFPDLCNYCKNMCLCENLEMIPRHHTYITFEKIQWRNYSIPQATSPSISPNLSIYLK